MAVMSRRRALRLGTYVLLGGLVCIYRAYVSRQPEDYPRENKHLDYPLNADAPSLSDIPLHHSLNPAPSQRHLLSLADNLANCTPPAIEQFPRDLFTGEQRRHGFLLIHIAVALYMFLGLAIICDEYFVPALEEICEALSLDSDVAGATFMAAGSSAPELATTVIGVFIAEGDIALGAVVGSAVFNIMFVISICALLSGVVVPLSWWPLTRDCVYYTISIIALVVVLADEIIMWYESIVFLVLYALYIVVMVFNSQLERFFGAGCSECLANYKTTYEETQKIMMAEINKQKYSQQKNEKEEGEDDEDNPAHVKTHLDMEPDDHSVLSMPDETCSRIQWVLSLPMLLLFVITVPDCRVARWRKWYLVTFLMSCVWISALSYVMVWMITVVGYTLHIPDTIMGLTFISIGASVPDAIASLLVIKDGYGDMAVSNAIGSNVFDILLCLGLPWFIKTVCVNPGTSITVYSAGLLYSSLTLLGTVVFLLLATHLNGWRLTKQYGVVLMVVYVLFMILASLYELNLFGYVHPPECETDY